MTVLPPRREPRNITPNVPAPGSWATPPGSSRSISRSETFNNQKNNKTVDLSRRFYYFPGCGPRIGAGSACEWSPSPTRIKLFRKNPDGLISPACADTSELSASPYVLFRLMLFSALYAYFRSPPDSAARFVGRHGRRDALCVDRRG